MIDFQSLVDADLLPGEGEAAVLSLAFGVRDA